MKAFVTGGGSGIGRAIAVTLARAGYDVAIQVHNSVQAGQDTVAEIEALGRNAGAVSADFADMSAARHSIASVQEDWGPFDALVLNAGISSATSIFDLEDVELDHVVDTNLKAPIVVAQEFMRARRAAGGDGGIVIIGSAAGQTGGALVGPHYVASKAGTHALVKSLALAGALLGLRVNGVAPGFIETAGLDRMRAADPTADPSAAEARVPIGRVGRPDEIAACVEFLLSNAASYVNGALLDANGGLVMR